MRKLLVASFFLMFFGEFLSGQEGRMIRLPEVKKDSHFSVERAISQRRSVRTYSSKSLSLQDVSSLLWAGQGITSPLGLRTAPSAGALYPLELYLVSFHVDSLVAGVYKYRPFSHGLELIKRGDVRNALYQAALWQEWVRAAPAVIVIAAVFERTTKKYGERGKNYVYFEAGCVAENIALMAERLEIGTVVVGAFFDESVKSILSLSRDEVPIALMPIGYK